MKTAAVKAARSKKPPITHTVGQLVKWWHNGFHFGRVQAIGRKYTLVSRKLGSRQTAIIKLEHHEISTDI